MPFAEPPVGTGDRFFSSVRQDLTAFEYKCFIRRRENEGGNVSRCSALGLEKYSRAIRGLFIDLPRLYQNVGQSKAAVAAHKTFVAALLESSQGAPYIAGLPLCRIAGFVLFKPE